MKSIIRLFSATFIATTTIATAAASPRVANQTFVYQITVHQQNTVDLSSLPASVRAQVESNVKKGNETPTVFVLTLNADRTNPDGSAHINASFTDSLEPNSPVFAKVDRFEGTLLPDGRFIATYDPNMPPTFDPRSGFSPSQNANIQAFKFVGMLADFNTFAAGSAKRGHFKAGDVWRASSRSAYGTSQTYEFTVTAVSGQIAAISMKSQGASASSSSTLNANGHYDAAAGLVLDLHEETASQHNGSLGPASSLSATYDFTLQR